MGAYKSLSHWRKNDHFRFEYSFCRTIYIYHFVLYCYKTQKGLPECITTKLVILWPHDLQPSRICLLCCTDDCDRVQTHSHKINVYTAEICLYTRRQQISLQNSKQILASCITKTYTWKMFLCIIAVFCCCFCCCCYCLLIFCLFVGLLLSVVLFLFFSLFVRFWKTVLTPYR